MKLFFAGDIVKFDETDFLMDSALTDVVKSADYAVANLEAPCFSQEFRKIPKRGPHLSQSPRVLKLLKDAGFTHCSLANNHIMDYGFDGLRETLAGMDKLGLVSYGANPAADSVYKPVFLEKDGTTVALCSLAEGGFGMSLAPAGGYAWVNAPEVGQMLEEAKKADFCIFSIHAGLENCDFPLPEWRQIYRTLCEKGVDVVIGHHPHVPQGGECWKNSLIFYSLGNFYFNGMMMSEKNDSAYSVFLELEKGKKITYSCCQHEQKNNRTCLTGTGFPDGLNEILTRTESDRKEVDDLARESLNTIYIHYYREAFQPVISRNPVRYFIRVVKKVLFRNAPVTEDELLWLQHNLCIESHRFIQLRCLYDRIRKLQ